jgi:hypothetical protein
MVMVLAIIKTSLALKHGCEDPNNKGSRMSIRIIKRDGHTRRDGQLTRILKRLG